MTNLRQETIDKYCLGEMEEAELRAFESKVSADPFLKSEIDLQKNIVDCLKQHRKLELKARLDAIDVKTSWISVQKSVLVKSLGGIMAVSIIAIGLYFNEEKAKESTPVVINAPRAYVWDLDIEKPFINVIKQEKSEEKKSWNKRTKENSKKPSIKMSRHTETYKPILQTPSIEIITDEEQFTGNNLDDFPEDFEVSVNESFVKVKVNSTKSKLIKYKYYDGKLFLNGDFNKSLYEILEINRSTGREIYIYYLGDYYKVNVTDELTELPVIHNVEVIRELEIFRQNK